VSPRKRRVDLALVVIGAGLLAGGGFAAYHFLAPRWESASKADAGDGGAGESLDGRLVPPEAYMRTYLELFGGLAPLDVQARARGPEGLFDTWDDYVSALGLPDYKLDVPRQTQTNALMVATFERLGVALCDRAVEADLGPKQPPVDKRVVFAFDVPKGVLDEAGFAPRFEVLHRTFLGYPTSLAPPERSKRFFDLYHSIVTEHASGSVHSKLSPEESGWAAVCYGLVRHPEFHLY
jgi:hypothetical protein